MATPQMVALDQALAEVEVSQPDPRWWAGQLADVAGAQNGGTLVTKGSLWLASDAATGARR